MTGVALVLGIGKSGLNPFIQARDVCVLCDSHALSCRDAAPKCDDRHRLP